jgi:MFS family permease
MRVWLGELSRKERLTLIGCFGGWSLDAFDTQIYPFTIASLIGLWGLSKGEAGLIGTATLIASALGGWGAGWLADRFGRVRVLLATLLGYAFFTFLCGFAWNFTSLLVFRTLEGVSFGGEWTAGAVLMAETIRDAWRGRAVGVVQSGWAVGWGAAALASTAAFALLPESLAWRSLFWMGILPAAFVLWIRRHLTEPHASPPAKGEKAKGLPIFRPPLLRPTLLIALMVVGAQALNYSVSIWLPAYLKLERGLSLGMTGGYMLLHIFGAWLGFVGGAHLADLWGRRATFLVSALAAIALLPLYLFLPLGARAVFWLGLPLGIALYLMFAPMGPFMSEMYPAACRGLGQGFCYNAGRAAGALFPALIGFFAARLGLGGAIALFGLLGAALMLAALAALPETRGRPLAASLEETLHAE